MINGLVSGALTYLPTNASSVVVPCALTASAALVTCYAANRISSQSTPSDPIVLEQSNQNPQVEQPQENDDPQEQVVEQRLIRTWQMSSGHNVEFRLLGTRPLFRKVQRETGAVTEEIQRDDVNAEQIQAYVSSVLQTEPTESMEFRSIPPKVYQWIIYNSQHEPVREFSFHKKENALTARNHDVNQKNIKMINYVHRGLTPEQELQIFLNYEPAMEGEDCTPNHLKAIPVFTWIIESKEIRLIRVGNDLSLRIIHKDTNTIKMTPMTYSGQIEDFISGIKNLIPVINGESIHLGSPPPVDCRWIINGKTIDLYHQGNKFFCTLHDPVANKTKKIALVRSNNTVEQQIEFIRSCQIVIADDPITFTMPINALRTYDSLSYSRVSIVRDLPCNGNHSIVLLEGANQQLYWQIEDVNTRIKKQIPFAAAQVLQSTNLFPVSEETRMAASNSAGRTKQDCLAILQEFYPQAIPTQTSFSLTLTPIIRQSHIDSRIHLTERQWGVTLIINDLNTYYHAMIVIEGLRQGNYFKEAWDFGAKCSQSGPLRSCCHRWSQAEVMMHEWTNIKPHIYQRTSVYKCARSVVEVMLRALEADTEKPELLPRLNLFGCNSILATKSEHNCFTWAREKLRIMGIDLGNTRSEFLFIHPPDFTQPEAELFNLPYLTNVANQL